MTQAGRALRRLDGALDELTTVLRAADSPWVGVLEGLRGRHGDAETRGGAIDELRSRFDGMGSPNDVVLVETNGNLPAGWSEEHAGRKLSRARRSGPWPRGRAQALGGLGALGASPGGPVLLARLALSTAPGHSRAEREVCRLHAQPRGCTLHCTFGSTT